MAKRVKRKHTTLFVECQRCNRLLEASLNDILNEGTEEYDWDTLALKGRCPNCGAFWNPNRFIPQRYFYADLVARVVGREE